MSMTLLLAEALDVGGIIDKYGVPTGILFFGGVALWKAARWFGENIARPLVVSHVSFVDLVQKNDTAIAETLRSHAATLTSLLDVSKQIVSTQTQLHELFAGLADHLQMTTEQAKRIEGPPR
jgi:hypothetical protein